MSNRLSFEVRPDDLTGAATRALLALHLSGMHASSPPGSVHALDLSGLSVPQVTVWTAWLGGNLAGLGALKTHGDGTGEVKSMRTHPNFLRRGAASAILETIVSAARDRNLNRLSLETGSGATFEAALSLYRKRGFRPGEPFGDYVKNEFNQFLHLRVV